MINKKLDEIKASLGVVEELMQDNKYLENLDKGLEKEKKINIELQERLNNIKQDLLYVLSQLDGYLDKGWTIDLNFTDIREKYKKDIEDYENWN